MAEEKTKNPTFEERLKTIESNQEDIKRFLLQMQHAVNNHTHANGKVWVRVE
jgi:chaperonin cofactor prefoldin